MHIYAHEVAKYLMAECCSRHGIKWTPDATKLTLPEETCRTDGAYVLVETKVRRDRDTVTIESLYKTSIGTKINDLDICLEVV